MIDDAGAMARALTLAQRGAAEGEVPVGAVLLRGGEIVAEGFNRPISACDPSAHAEMVALRAGAQALRNYRLVDTTLYVTLEPCAMCAGAIVSARVRRLVFAAWDPRAGAVRSVFQVVDHERLNHRVEWEGGVCEAESAALLRAFFQARRPAGGAAR